MIGVRGIRQLFDRNRPSDLRDQLRTTSYRQLLGNRRFTLLVLAYGVNTFGNWVTVVAALSLAAFKWQSSPLELAGLVAVFLVPSAVLAPVAGWLADRMDKKKLLVTANLMGAALILPMLAVQNLWQAYLLLFVLRAVTSVNLPAMSAMVPALVSREQILIANGVILQPAHITRALSPILAGVLMATVGSVGAFTLDSITYVVAALIVAAIPSSLSSVREAGLSPEVDEGADSCARLSLIDSVRKAFYSSRILVLVMLAAVGSFAFGGLESAIPVYVRELLSDAPAIYGASISALGAGSIMGALMSGQLSQRWDRLGTVIIATFIGGAGLILIASIHSTGWLLSGVALAGFGAGIGLTAAQSLIHEETDPGIHATTLGLMWAISNSATVTGIFLAGLAISITGVGATSWALGLAMLLPAVVALQLRPVKARQALPRSLF